MYPGIIETERLLLRPMTAADAPSCFVWCADPEVNRFMTYPRYTDPSQVTEWLARMENDPLIRLYGYERKEDGLLIGSGSLTLKPSGRWNIGYNLCRDCWGRGYATEAARAMLEAGIRDGLTSFEACHATANAASARVLEKCGLIPSHDGEYAKYDGSETFPAKFWKLDMEG